MALDETIRSRANPLLKRAAGALAGEEPGTLAIEGDRLVDDALRARVRLEIVLVASDRPERAGALIERGVPVRLVDADLLGRVSRLKTSPGILALAPAPAPVDLARLALDERSILLVAASVSDPGNLGALARSAEAFGAAAFLVTSGSASPWSDKALRGSMGSLLRIPVVHGQGAEALIASLERRGVRQVCAATRGGKDAREFDWRGPLALWMGSEVGALPERARGFEPVTIPMTGEVESLNVAVAASLLLYASRSHENRSSAGEQSANGRGMKDDRRA